MEIHYPFVDVNIENTIHLCDTCYTIHPLPNLTLHYSKVNFALWQNTSPLKGKKIEVKTKKSYEERMEKVFYTPVPPLLISFSLLSQ